MEVPKYIQDRMRKVAKYAKRMSEEMRIVDEWFYTHGYDVELLRAGDGSTLEELEYGNDITDEFCADFAAGKYES